MLIRVFQTLFSPRLSFTTVYKVCIPEKGDTDIFTTHEISHNGLSQKKDGNNLLFCAKLSNGERDLPNTNTGKVELLLVPCADFNDRESQIKTNNEIVS